MKDDLLYSFVIEDLKGIEITTTANAYGHGNVSIEKLPVSTSM